MSVGRGPVGPGHRLATAAAVAGIVGAVAGIVFGVAELVDDAGSGPSQSPSSSSTSPSTASPVTTAAPTSAAPTTTSVPPTTTTPSRPPVSTTKTSAPVQRERNLSPEDYIDHDAASGTGLWRYGSFESSSGKPNPHSLGMTAGCQNWDGGDMWVDSKLGQGWNWLQLDVSLSEDSSSDSDVSYAIIDPRTKRELASGELTIGRVERHKLQVTGIPRIRFMINEPSAPDEMCGPGEKKTVVVFGRVKLST